MIISVRDSKLVRPAEETPSNAIWISNVDLVVANRYTLLAMFYRCPATSTADFFNPAFLEQALSRSLVPFYPFAGRLRLDKDGRTEIDCNGEGALFVVAESTATIDDLGDFTPSEELRKLIPPVDYSANISLFPLLMLQVTFFKCGGVSVGIGTHHRAVDGQAGLHFVHSRSDIVRGLDVKVKPFFDRTILRARDPPQPQFPHIEYQISPTKTTEADPTGSSEHTTTTTMYKITQEQLKNLKRKTLEECKSSLDDKNVYFSTYEVVAGHAWRCRCMASGVDHDQDTKLYIATNGRPRLQPPIPDGYFGNVLFIATPMAKVGDLLSEPTSYAANKIKETAKQMDNNYLRSALDYLELLPDKSLVVRRADVYRPPNLGITSWIGLPAEVANFGWGPPMYMGPLTVPYEGLAYLVRSPEGDGSLSLAISLRTEHMKGFQEMFYDF